MTESIDADKNRQIAEKLGMCWHKVVDQQPYEIDGVSVGSLFICSCGMKLYGEVVAFHERMSNPDFTSDPGKVLLLREMMKREDWDKFITSDYVGLTGSKGRAIYAKLITNTTGKLRDAVWEFLFGGKP